MHGSPLPAAILSGVMLMIGCASNTEQRWAPVVGAKVTRLEQANQVCTAEANRARTALAPRNPGQSPTESRALEANIVARNTLRACMGRHGWMIETVEKR